LTSSNQKVTTTTPVSQLASISGLDCYGITYGRSSTMKATQKQNISNYLHI